MVGIPLLPPYDRTFPLYFLLLNQNHLLLTLERDMPHIFFVPYDSR